MDFWQKIITALAGAPGVVWLCKWLFERWAVRDAARLARQEQHEKEHAGVEIAEIGVFPEMIKLYTTELRSLRTELRETNERWEKKLSETTARMEREAIRMMNFIGHLVEVSNKMRNRLYLCDTLMHLHDRTWVSHDFTEIVIPSFKDPPA
jgi:C4-dicarboxylate-specific signal transduction histidine kinase